MSATPRSSWRPLPVIISVVMMLITVASFTYALSHGSIEEVKTTVRNQGEKIRTLEIAVGEITTSLKYIQNTGDRTLQLIQNHVGLGR